MKFDLISPTKCVGWTFTISVLPPDQISTEIRQSLNSLINTPIVRRALPRLSANCLGWMEVEFASTDESLILQAWQFIESGLK